MYKKNCVWMDFVLEQRQPYFFYVSLVLNWPGETGDNFLPASFFPRKSIDRASLVVAGAGSQVQGRLSRQGFRCVDADGVHVRMEHLVNNWGNRLASSSCSCQPGDRRQLNNLARFQG